MLFPSESVKQDCRINLLQDEKAPQKRGNFIN